MTRNVMNGTMTFNEKITRFSSSQRNRFSWLFECYSCRFQCNNNTLFLIHKSKKRCCGINNWFKKHLDLGYSDYFLVVHRYHFQKVIIDIGKRFREIVFIYSITT